MSLARSALRLAAFEALCPEATVETGPYPTMAANRVFDSRIDLIQADEQLSKLEDKPLLIVYTEEDTSTPYPGGKKMPDDQVVVLVVEAMIAARGTIDLAQEDGSTLTVGTLDAPVTDRQHEALLDALEASVRRLFDRRTRSPSAVIFGLVALEIHRIESYPQRASDRTTRLAARTIKFHVKVKPDAWPSIATDPAPTGLDALPEPLRSVAAALPAGSTALAVCLQIVGFIQPPAPLPPMLEGIGIATDVNRDPDNAFPSQVETLVDPQDP